MPHFKIYLTASLLLLLCACHDKPAPEPQADSPPDPKMQALLNTPVSDINEDTVNDFLSEDSRTEPANEESEPTPEHLTEPEAQYQEEFELKVYREETQSTMTGYIDKIDILSLNDQPTTIKNVVVNRGHCRVVSLYDCSTYSGSEREYQFRHLHLLILIKDYAEPNKALHKLSTLLV